MVQLIKKLLFSLKKLLSEKAKRLRFLFFFHYLNCINITAQLLRLIYKIDSILKFFFKTKNNLVSELRFINQLLILKKYKKLLTEPILFFNNYVCLFITLAYSQSKTNNNKIK